MTALPLPDPPLRTARCLLRPWEPADAAALAAAWQDPLVRRWTGVPERHDEVAARAWIEQTPALRRAGRSLDLVIEHAGAVAGEVGAVVHGGSPPAVEVGWWLGPAHRGQGLAAEGVRAFVGWLLEGDGGPRLPEVEARCAVANEPAEAVAAAAGFVPVEEPSRDGVRRWRAGSGRRGGTLHP